MNLHEIAKNAKQAALQLSTISTEIKNKALKSIAEAIEKNKGQILKENKKDIALAEKEGIAKPLIKRLALDDGKIKEMAQGIHDVMKQEDPVGKTLASLEMDKDLVMYQVSVPIGVIGAVFESRPDATVQVACLCLKSGNAAILKGGKEALNTNRILVRLMAIAAEKAGITKNSLQLIETREEVKEMLKLNQYIDLLIPRGSNAFVKFIQDNTKIPVLGHAEGICHVYIDKDADMKQAANIAFDAKCQYHAVCNAMETLLVHKDIAKTFLPRIAARYKEAKVELRGDPKTRAILKGIKAATEKDWSTEYNDLILSIKVVSSAEEAIGHINRYGSKHTESIVTENPETAYAFLDKVDAAVVLHNASTRFSDGYRFGKGAEVGIATSKIHARGPVGLEGLVIYKYKVLGKGHIVKDYVGKNSKRFTHRKLDKKFGRK